MKKAPNIYFYPGRKRQPYVFKKTYGGKTVSRAFSNLTAAKDYAARFLKTLAGSGKAAMEFSATELAEFREAKKIAGKNSVLKIVREWAKHESATAASSSLGAALDAWISWLRANGRAARYVYACDLLRQKLTAAFDPSRRLESFCSNAEMEQWIVACAERGLSGKTINNLRWNILGFFNWAKSMRLCTGQPQINALLLPRVQKAPVGTWTSAEAERAMRIIETRFPEFVPFAALRLFAGVRMAEARKMKWEWIDVPRRRITVPARDTDGTRICKTGDDWVLYAPTLIPETVFAWLAPFVRTNGFVTPQVGNYRFEKLTREIGNPPQNVWRHTFATMHLAWSGSASRSCDATRHTNLKTFTQHYRGVNVPPDDAARFWSLRPTASNGYSSLEFT